MIKEDIAKDLFYRDKKLNHNIWQNKGQESWEVLDEESKNYFRKDADQTINLIVDKLTVIGDKEIQVWIDDYWELYRDLWNDDVISEGDCESGIDYWKLEAQLQHTIKEIKG